MSKEIRINLNEKINSKPTLINLWHKNCYNCGEYINELNTKYSDTELHIINVLDITSSKLSITPFSDIESIEKYISYLEDILYH